VYGKKLSSNVALDRLWMPINKNGVAISGAFTPYLIFILVFFTTIELINSNTTGNINQKKVLIVNVVIKIPLHNPYPCY
jgi:hypothetical protein